MIKLAIFSITFALGLCASSFSVAAPAPENEQPKLRIASDGESQWAKGRVLVVTREGDTERQFDRFGRRHRMRSKIQFGGPASYIIELEEGADEVEVMEQFKRSRRFKAVELDQLVAPAASVSDPYYSSSWALPKINAPDAWDWANGSGITIAILDSGVDSTHPDLADNIVPGRNVFDSNYDTTDVHGHGTKVAGAAAAVANNGKGSAGVAWGAKIMPIRISDTTGYALFSNMATGVRWAADNGARVANISYAGAHSSQTVITAANYMRGKGGIVVVSSGNDGKEVNTTASTALMVVGATTSSDALASWSNYGVGLDITAPGNSIYTTNRGGGYGNSSGTSFASPITAAVVALVMSANPSLTPAAIDQIIFNTAVDLGAPGYDIKFGHGRIDAGAALLATASTIVDEEPPIVEITAPLAGTVSGETLVDVECSDNVGVARVELYMNSQKIFTDTSAPFGFLWDTYEYTNGVYTLEARAYDYADNEGISDPVIVTVYNRQNTAPSATPQSVTTLEDTPLQITLSGVDAEDDPLTFSIISQPTKGTLGALSGNRVTYTPNPNYHGTDSFTFTASDYQFTSGPATISITISSVNDEPVLTAFEGTPTSGMAPLAVSFTASATDVDGDTLSYVWNFGDGNSSSPAATGDASHTYTAAGAFTAVVTVSDGAGGSATGAVSIAVSEAPRPPTLKTIANKQVTELDNLTFNAEVDDPGYPLLPLHFALDTASRQAGMSLNGETGAFSWKPAVGQGTSQRTVTITLYAGATSEMQVVSLASDSFENEPISTPLSSLEGWSGSGKITDAPAAPINYQGAFPLPEATHTKTLEVSGDASRAAVGTGVVTVDMMIQPLQFLTEDSVDVAADAQFALTFNTEGNPLVYHSVPDGLGFEQVWTEVVLPSPIRSNDWVRVGVVTDYESSARPNPLFQVLLNGSVLTHATALDEPDLDCQTTGGTWFIAASGTTVGNSNSTGFNALDIRGAAVLDDVVLESVVKTPSDSKTFNIDVLQGSGGELDSDNDGIPDDWEVAYGLDPNDNSDANLDSDGDGFTNLQEYIAGTDPTDANSFFRADEVKANDTTVGLRFRSVLGRVYGVERRDSLDTGYWTTLKTNIPGTGEVIEVTDPNPAPEARFYRLTVSLP